MNRTRLILVLAAGPLLVLAAERAVGQAATQAASQAADSVSVPQLMKNLDSDDLRVAKAAARSLGVIFAPGGKGGPELPAVTKMLIEHLASPRGADLRRESAVALGQIRASSAADALKKAMSDTDILVAIAAGEAVSGVLPGDEARTFLIQQAQDPSEVVRTAALHGLASVCKPEDLPVLRKGLGVRNWRTQIAVVKGLQRAAHAGAQLTAEDYAAVAKILGSEIVNAADEALRFFGAVRNVESFRAVQAAADTKDDGTDESWRMRAQALRTIYHLGSRAMREALPVVVRQLGDRTANVTGQAKAILDHLREERRMSQGEIFPVLLEELEKAQPLALRAGIMEEMGHDVDSAYASRVAKVAADTLDRSAQDKAAWRARAGALVLLGASGYVGTMDKIAACVADDVTNVRNAAGRALEQLHALCPPDQKAVVAQALQPLLAKPDDWHKTAVAARAAGRYAQPQTIGPLTALLGHEVLNVRLNASHSLVQIVAGDDAALRAEIEKAAYRELEANDRAWEFGAPVLGALKDRRAVPLLTTILQKGDWRAQAAAAAAAAQVASAHPINDKPLSDALIRAGQSEILQVQDAANKALRALNQGK